MRGLVAVQMFKSKKVRHTDIYYFLWALQKTSKRKFGQKGELGMNYDANPVQYICIRSLVL